MPNTYVRVLTGSAKLWEERATYANLKMQVRQLSSMARKQDQLTINFSGRGVNKYLYCPFPGWTVH